MLMFETPLLAAALILQVAPAPPSAPHVSQCGAPTGSTPHGPIADCCLHFATWTSPVPATRDHTPSEQAQPADERTREDVATH